MSAREVIGQFGVSRRTVYRWLARYEQGGQAALHNRGSRPHKSPRRIPLERVASLAALRRRLLSCLQICFFLPISSVTLELRRLGLNKFSPMQPNKPSVIRHEPKHPSDMIHLDIKKSGRIDGMGHRITGDGSKRGRKPSWEYLHVCVDDNSRASYSELLPDEKVSSCFYLEET